MTFDPRQKPERGTYELDRDHPLSQGLFDLFAFDAGACLLGVNLATGGPVAAGNGSGNADLPMWAPGDGGMAAYCTNGAYWGVPDHGNLVARDFSVHVRFRPRTWTGGFTTVVSKPTSGSSREFGVFADTSGNITYLTVGGNNPGFITLSTGMTAGRWWSLTITRSAALSSLSVYVNGVLRASQGSLANGTTAAAGQQLRAGFDLASAGGSNANADYDVLATWRRCLSPTEIAGLHAEPYAMLRPTLRRVYSVPSAVAYTLTAAAGAVPVAGVAASLATARRLTASTGTVTAAASAASLLAGRRLPSDAGACAIVAPATGLYVARTLPAAAGTAAVTGVAAGLLTARRVPAAVGAVPVVGRAANLIYTRTTSGLLLRRRRQAL